MQTIVLYSATLALTGYLYRKDPTKTRASLRKAWKAFENILPQFLGIIVLVGIMMAIVDPELISSLLGRSSGWYGVFLASVVGSITLIPAFVAFPTAAMLLDGGAGTMQIGAFISSLMMVGIVTLPLEISTFGVKPSVLRNLLAFGFSFVVAFVIGGVAP